jgi:hypothetical protein
MYHKTSSILALVLASFLAGCVAHGPAFSDAKPAPPAPGFALVYVFREHAEPTAFGATVFFDESRVATLNQKGFTWAYLAPGEHRIRTRWPLLATQRSTSVTLNVVAGETYVLDLRAIMRVEGPDLVFGSGMGRLDPQSGVARISRCCRFQRPERTHYPAAARAPSGAGSL